MTIKEYKKEHNIIEIIDALREYDYYGFYQDAIGEIIAYIRFLEKELGEEDNEV